jgi:hypothetical protein
MNRDQKSNLIEMIDRFLSGVWTYDQFYSSYYVYFSDVLTDDALTDRELTFFGAVHEKMDFTDENPDDESRSYGWIDVREFRDWLRGVRNQTWEQESP